MLLQTNGVMALGAVCAALPTSTIEPATVTSLLDCAALTAAEGIVEAGGTQEAVAVLWLRAYLMVARSSPKLCVRGGGNGPRGEGHRAHT